MKSGDVLGGKYRLEQEIGKGAMGEVWSAYDHDQSRRVALKAILPQERESLTKDLRKRLLREADACRKLSHPNIVRIFDAGEMPGGEPFIVLELLHGQTLGDRLKEKRRIDPAMAARIAGEVASGLAVAHAAHVIHRDLKPANIFLHRDEGMAEGAFVSKVLDFGVCKDLDSIGVAATQTGIAVGSPAYMSPEQVGMRKDIDHRTDIWSLGILLFEMLTGARPFGGSIQEVIRLILFTPVPAPSSRVRDVPGELDAIVARCTAAKREDRYTNADELASALLMIARTMKPMTRRPTFTGMEAAPSGRPISRPDFEAVAMPGSALSPAPIVTPIVGPIATPIVAPAAAVAPSTNVDDDGDAAATLPFQGRMMMDLRRNTSPAAHRESAPNGTAIMQSSEPLASPAPGWKNEMHQALAAHRESRAVIDVGGSEQAAGGNTQAISDSQVQYAPPFDPVGTTSGAGALSHRSSGYPAPPTPLSSSTPRLSVEPAVSTGKHKKDRKVLFALMGVAVVAAIGVMGLLVLNAEKLGAKNAPSSAAEAKLMESAVLLPHAPEVAEPPATAAPPEPPATSAAPVLSVSAAPSPAPTLPVTAASSVPPRSSVTPPPSAPPTSMYKGTPPTSTYKAPLNQASPQHSTATKIAPWPSARTKDTGATIFREFK